jgi:hypothetical protein
VVGVNPYVFIVGCPHLGTTLLQRMVDAHAEIAVPRETHWIPESFKREFGITADGFVTHELLESLLAHPKFGNLGIEREQLEPLLAADGRLSYAGFVSALFDVYGERRGKRLVGDKARGYVREIPILHGLWPRARFVHLIRDGRDVCLSATTWERKAQHFRRRFRTWDDDPTTTAALWWAWHVRLGREAGAKLASDLDYEIRYETLVTDPKSECRKLCTFLDIAYDQPCCATTREGLGTRPAFRPSGLGFPRRRGCETGGRRCPRTRCSASRQPPASSSTNSATPAAFHSRMRRVSTERRGSRRSLVRTRRRAGDRFGRPLPEGR